MALIQWIQENPVVGALFLFFGAVAIWFFRWSFGKEAEELTDTLDHVEKPKHPDGIMGNWIHKW